MQDVRRGRLMSATPTAPTPTAVRPRRAPEWLVARAVALFAGANLRLAAMVAVAALAGGVMFGFATGRCSTTT